MATTRGKKGIKKSARMNKGKTLQTVKPLTKPMPGTESISLNFDKPSFEYKQQN
jgi:hypothetical protein